jgi:para-aminobenzoate synthetase component 1
MHYQISTRHKEKRTSYLKILSSGELETLRSRLTNWLRNYEIFCWLDSNQYYIENQWSYHSFDLLIGAGIKDNIVFQEGQTFNSINEVQHDDWLLGFLGYDLKNEIENLHSDNLDLNNLPTAYFFKPEVLIFLKNNILTIESANSNQIWNQIIEAETLDVENKNQIILKPRISREDYISKVEAIRNHIENGDVYELNLCQEFYSENSVLDAFQLWKDVNRKFPQPFSAFIKINNKYIISASMERFLRRENTKVISQPIKGTTKRGSSPVEDIRLAHELQSNEKERAENIMIVDLVRNDLAKNCKSGTVQVEELCAIYQFPGVLQMISTITGEVKENTTSTDLIKGAFPMGSMTGAPKVRSMQLIEEYEETKRGIYSGAIGYFTPNGDFDFNVVIRTLVYNESEHYLSLHVGSAITYDSIPENEYDECLLKINGWKDLLSGFDHNNDQ